MKYNRIIKHKITVYKAVKNANDYKLEYTIKSSLLKELEQKIPFMLGYQQSNYKPKYRTNKPKFDMTKYDF